MQRFRVDVPYVVVAALPVRGDEPSSVGGELDGLGGRLRGLEDVQRLERVCILKPDCAVVGPRGDQVASGRPRTTDDQVGVSREHRTRNTAEVPNYDVREPEANGYEVLAVGRERDRLDLSVAVGDPLLASHRMMVPSDDRFAIHLSPGDATREFTVYS